MRSHLLKLGILSAVLLTTFSPLQPTKASTPLVLKTETAQVVAEEVYLRLDYELPDPQSIKSIRYETYLREQGSDRRILGTTLSGIGSVNGQRVMISPLANSEIVDGSLVVVRVIATSIDDRETPYDLKVKIDSSGKADLSKL